MAANNENSNGNNNDDVYVFKDAKKSGTITFIKKWKDNKSNDERPVPDIEISTKKPESNVIQYRITFHGNGLLFDDGTTENTITYNSSGQILSGQYKMPNGIGVCWYSDKECTQRISFSDNGELYTAITGDMDFYAKETTFVIKTGKEICSMIPDTITSVIFTDEIEPENYELLDMDYDGDGGVFGWIENDTVLKISTGIKNKKVIANADCSEMFYNKTNIESIDFQNLDFSNVTSMGDMFNGCSNLSTLDLDRLDVSKVTNMSGTFFNCFGLEELDLSKLNTENLKSMQNTFYGCTGLHQMDISMLNTSKVTTIAGIFMNCRNIETINMHGIDTQNVVNMSGMFSNCRTLTTLDITGFSTSKVTNFSAMFTYCSSLKNIDLSEFNTSSAGNMNSMFYGCMSITTLDLSAFDTSKNPQMVWMLGNCRNLNKLILGSKFAFRGTQIGLPEGTWQNADGDTFTSDGAANDIPGNVADTYIKIG